MYTILLIFKMENSFSENSVTNELSLTNVKITKKHSHVLLF